MPEKYHIVGIGGAGMSAIAIILLEMGYAVSGSDLRATEVTESLAKLGIEVHIGHAAPNLPKDVDAVAVSTAIRSDNIEIAAALERSIPVRTRAEVLAEIAATKRCIAVAGSDGKTTTASMLTTILRAADWKPSYLIGAKVNVLGSAHYDAGEWMVIEADESDGTMLKLPVKAAIVGNVVPDHLGHYGSFDELIMAFLKFTSGVSGPVVVGADDPVTARFAEESGYRSAGFADGAAMRITNYEATGLTSSFELSMDGRSMGTAKMQVPGKHNARNAACAAALAYAIGVSPDAIIRGLSEFQGVARRFQMRGEREGITYIDDYAHLPGEVAAAIAAAKEGSWKRVIVVFQPHRYTRTQQLWRDFADCFLGADHLLLTDLYAAGEDLIPGVSGHLILNAVLDAHPSLPVGYFPTRADLMHALAVIARPGDLVLTLGAGDVTQLPEEILGKAA